ncbi:MAG: hypothetical protein PHU69_11090 [Fermentimonas sp.]|nr:hypothetical protein [Fermentimonas sp.]
MAWTKPGKGGEIQLTDTLKVLVGREDMYAYDFIGKRYDVGNKQGFLEATGNDGELRPVTCCRKTDIESFGKRRGYRNPKQWREHQADYFASRQLDRIESRIAEVGEKYGVNREGQV